MVVLVSVVEDGDADEDEERVCFEGVFANKDECIAGLPVFLTGEGVTVDGDEGEAPIKFDPGRHEIELTTSDSDIEVTIGAATTEQFEVMIDFGEDADEEGPVPTGYYVLCFDVH